MDTETANTSRTITENEIQHMPAFQRDVTQLIQLTPGVQADGAQSAGGGGYAAPALNPAPATVVWHLGRAAVSSLRKMARRQTPTAASSEQWLCSGRYQHRERYLGRSDPYHPEPGFVGNVKIVTNAYDAENGRFSGAITQITSKSGTNSIHAALSSRWFALV